MNSINFLQRGKNINNKEIVLGIQHLLAAFGATTLVPLLTGFSVPVALFTAGLGTLIFHIITKFKVPIFLGSSFAFIPVVVLVTQITGSTQYAQGGIVVAGLLYVLFSLIVSKLGIDKVSSFFKPHIVGTMILIIGLTLMPVAVEMSLTNWEIAGLVFSIAIIIQILGQGFFKQMSIIVGVGIGYIVAIFVGLVDLSPLVEASWFVVPNFSLPKFDLQSIGIIAPVVFAVFMEHIGDISANQTVTGKNYLEDPGLHRTLLGDGVATIVAGLLGGPANTTYSENTGVLALTHNYNPRILRIAAVFAIIVSFVGKITAFFAGIPIFIIGGISLVLFGMISIIGLKTLIKDKSWTNPTKIITVILMLVIGLGPQWNIGIFSLSSISAAALTGIIIDRVAFKVFK
jgi:uracil permease